MPEPSIGAQAKDAPLVGLDGEPTTLAFARGLAPAAIFFFKVDCPTCHVVLPAVERLHQAYGGVAARVLGISQDDAGATRRWLESAKATFPTLLDGPGFAASEAFGVATVPSLFLLDAEGRVARVETGWSRQAWNEVSKALAAATGHPYAPASPSGDGAPAWKPG